MGGVARGLNYCLNGGKFERGFEVRGEWGDLRGLKTEDGSFFGLE
jgi:hypothetical protein